MKYDGEGSFKYEAADWRAMFFWWFIAIAVCVLVLWDAIVNDFTFWRWIWMMLRLLVFTSTGFAIN
jgi:hypothetical protein